MMKTVPADGSLPGSDAAAAKRPVFRSAKRRPVARIVSGVVVVAAIAAGVGYRLRPKPVTAADVTRGTAIDAVYATATVEAMDRVTVKAKVPGSLLDLNAREGDTVKKGDLLAVLDSPSLKFQLDRGRAEQWAASQQAATKSPQVAVLEAQARMTEANLKNAKEELGRLQRLVASGSAAPAELERATNAVALHEAQLASQRAQANALRIDLSAKSSGSNAAVSELAAKLSDTEVRAPIDGVVLARLVEPGELVPANGALFRLGDVSKLVLECAVDEADVGRLAVGKKAAVSLYAFPKRVFHGEIFAIFPDADRAKKSFLVKVRLADAPAELRSGMSAEVNFLVDEHPNALLVPADALDASNSVWVVRDGRVDKRTVTLGIRDMLRVEVLSGLGEGDRVVTTGLDTLTPGARVSATVSAPQAATAAPKSTSSGGSL